MPVISPCRLAEFPCRYLGIPLSLRRLKRSEASRIPTWKSGLLTEARKLLLTMTTLSAIPVHISIALCLSGWAVEEIDKCRRAFLWQGTRSTTGGRCKVSWNIVCSPRENGGLGVPDLRITGFALRLRWGWLKRTRGDNAAWAC